MKSDKFGDEVFKVLTHSFFVKNLLITTRKRVFGVRSRSGGNFKFCGSLWLICGSFVAISCSKRILVWGKGAGGNTWLIFRKSWLIRQIYVAKTSSVAGFCVTVVQGSAST